MLITSKRITLSPKLVRKSPRAIILSMNATIIIARRNSVSIRAIRSPVAPVALLAPVLVAVAALLTRRIDLRNIIRRSPRAASLAALVNLVVTIAVSTGLASALLAINARSPSITGNIVNRVAPLLVLRVAPLPVLQVAALLAHLVVPLPVPLLALQVLPVPHLRAPLALAKRLYITNISYITIILYYITIVI